MKLKKRICLLLCLVTAAGFVSAHPVKESTHVDLTGKDSYLGVKVATGATVTASSLMKEDNIIFAGDAGAVALEKRADGDTDTHAIENTLSWSTIV